MKFRDLIITTTQAALWAALLTIGVKTRLTWLTLAGLLLAGLATVIGQAGWWPRPQIGRICLVAGWVGALLAPAGFLINRGVWVWNNDFSAIIWLLVAVVLIGVHRVAPGRLKTGWKILGVAWGFLGAVSNLAVAYTKSLTPEFYLALFSALALLLLCRLWFRPRPWGIQLLHTLILSIVALPLADAVVRHHASQGMQAAPGAFYSYADYKRNPAAYVQWIKYYEERYHKMEQEVFEPDPEHIEPFILRRSSHGYLLQSRVDINHLGFRGQEISTEKGDAYRIVALGESTTFGITLKETDQPWPEVLERLIRERIKTTRKVQVINAGIPAYTLHSNIRRLPWQILPLKPDLILSYHGINGFDMIDIGLPPMSGKPPPRYRDRPVRFLANFEYALRLRAYKKTLVPGLMQPGAILSQPMATQYAREYEQLIALAQTNHVQLALANYSMAANDRSTPGLVNFYAAAYPNVIRQIEANRVHTEIIKDLVTEHPQACFIDTQPQFDGQSSNFIDLVHLTQKGRDKLAEVFFAGIKPILEKALSPPPTNAETLP